ncbi:hypothetical protein A0J61_08064 [Choanephora cucurbitarum]|uniref:Uncharacterized protein n=1 Tax=Choanephora cucurbitarum TaxID=101091 RepID=A0A1C7N4D2_9FUNG|nr:hypothetical protein A0J61_08064 [Choanephora cucurbitarum]
MVSIWTQRVTNSENCTQTYKGFIVQKLVTVSLVNLCLCFIYKSREKSKQTTPRDAAVKSALAPSRKNAVEGVGDEKRIKGSKT